MALRNASLEYFENQSKWNHDLYYNESTDLWYNFSIAYNKHKTVIISNPFMRVANPTCYDESHSSEWVLTVVEIERGEVCLQDGSFQIALIWI